jgi:hypothetical protein
MGLADEAINEDPIDPPVTRSYAVKDSGKPTALDLFSGTGSVSDELQQQGYHVTTLDQDPACDATWTCDILTWDYRQYYRPGDFDLVSTSPPRAQNSAAPRPPFLASWTSPVPW